MNYLAHIFLSKDHIEYQLGNLLADPLKGKAWADSHPLLLEGMKMHKTIDKFTDRHPLVKQSKSRLKHKGYLKGVVIDVVYDYMLSKHWDSYSLTPLKIFIETFHHNAIEQIKTYPKKAHDFVNKIITHDALLTYGTVEGLELTFNRIDKRLSERIRAKESMQDYMGIVIEQLDEIEKDFQVFFPQLIRHVAHNENHL